MFKRFRQNEMVKKGGISILYICVPAKRSGLSVCLSVCLCAKKEEVLVKKPVSASDLVGWSVSWAVSVYVRTYV